MQMTQTATGLPKQLSFNDAIDLHRKGDFATAAAAYRAILREHPGNAQVWTNLGAALRSLGKLEAAMLCHRRSLYHQPGNEATIANLCNAMREDGQYVEARKTALVETAGLSTGTASSVARDLQGMGQWRRSLDAFGKALAEKPDDAELNVLRATSHFMLGDYAKGLADYGERFRFSPANSPNRKSPRWTGGPATGRRLLVLCEQGLGDMVMVSRFMPKLRETWEEIWLTSRGPTKRLFEGVSYVDRVFHKDEPPEQGAEDAHIPAMDLMTVFDLRPDHCPAPAALNIPADARERAARIMKPYKDFFRIGICWAGSPTFVQAKRKATELWRFLELADIPGVQLFGMCKGEREADIEELGAEGLIVNTAATDRDFADAAALVEQLDLVITVDTGLGHVAATLGKETWVLLPRPPFWYWGHTGERTYWYESMRLIRQDSGGDWSGPFRTIRCDLENRLM